jgi:hypothetical protein
MLSGCTLQRNYASRGAALHVAGGVTLLTEATIFRANTGEGSSAFVESGIVFYALPVPVLSVHLLLQKLAT